MCLCLCLYHHVMQCINQDNTSMNIPASIVFHSAFSIKISLFQHNPCISRIVVQVLLAGWRNHNVDNRNKTITKATGLMGKEKVWMCSTLFVLFPHHMTNFVKLNWNTKWCHHCFNCQDLSFNNSDCHDVDFIGSTQESLQHVHKCNHSHTIYLQLFILVYQGLKKALSGSPGLVPFLAGQVNFKAHVSNG